jgi:eukaryotic-like serine/threonine-protein kinase
LRALSPGLTAPEGIPNITAIVSGKQRMIGETVSHYRVLGKLGRGGMGVVYEAQDLRLGRHVAIKFIPELLDDFGNAARRLQREALALSALNHPNICTVFELGEHEGKPYLVEEMLAGATFQEVIEKRHTPLSGVLDLAVQAAEGLNAAHANGLIHRDIKPPNLFLTREGRVKILDFGLAKHAPELMAAAGEDAVTMESDEDGVTSPGRILGTLNYMSPEQLRGEPATAASDIFSLGIVLHELLYGSHPFKRKSSLETASAILTEPIPSSVFPLHIASQGLSRVLEIMLSKNPHDRYPTAGALLADLKKIRTGVVERAKEDAGPRTGFATRPSIAVLPFVNMSSDAENEYFSDGLAEELISALAKLEGLRVAARTSAFRFRGKEVDIREVGRELGVQSVLEGSVRKSGSRVRISAQLLNVEDGYHLWSETYDRELQDVFAIQEEIAEAIVRQLEVRLGLKAEPTLVARRTVNVDAYNLYLQGRYFWNRRGAIDLQKAAACFRQALEKDPKFAASQVGLADCFVVLGIQGERAPGEVFPLAGVAARQALAIDPDLAEGHTSLACVEAVYEWNWRAAEERFLLAISLNRQYSTAHHWYATHVLLPLGRFAEAGTQIALARRIDPLSRAVVATVGLVAYFERNFDLAIEELRKTLEMDPHFGLAHYFLGQAYEQKGQYRDAIASLGTALQINPGSSEVMAALGHARAGAGDVTGASEILRQLSEKAQREYVSPVLISQVLLGLGRKEEAIDAIERAQQTRATDLIWLKVRPVFDDIQSEPRVAKIRTAVGLDSMLG